LPVESLTEGVAVVSKHCQSCGRDGHPREQHPSSLKTELAIWLVALTIGVAAGLWSAATASARNPLSLTAQSFTLSSVQTAPAEAIPEAPVSGGSDSQTVAWLTRIIVAFLKAAWWVLPIPIAFSVWRQWSTYPVCVACGSRRLGEVPTPHGAALPLEESTFSRPPVLRGR
jgi:hypothetical protein